jgi:cell wall-associated NlpC family hydrolase
MNKKLIAMIGGSSLLLLTMCSSAAVGSTFDTKLVVPMYTVPTKEIFLTTDTKPATFMERQAYLYEKEQEQIRLKNKQLRQNFDDLRVAIENTYKYINKTYYVFSGSTPEGWDCSGLVMWTYSHLGFNLYHSATTQMEFGELTNDPKFGDVVGFKYNKSDSYYHVGIYVSEDLMLHSGGKRGDVTEFKSISRFAGKHSKVFYSRLIETY